MTQFCFGITIKLLYSIPRFNLNHAKLLTLINVAVSRSLKEKQMVAFSVDIKTMSNPSQVTSCLTLLQITHYIPRKKQFVNGIVSLTIFLPIQRILKIRHQDWPQEMPKSHPGCPEHQPEHTSQTQDTLMKTSYLEMWCTHEVRIRKGIYDIT